MYCTNFYKTGEFIRRVALGELKKAVRAHGGVVRFEDEDNRVCVSFNVDGGPVDVYIEKVTAHRGQALRIYGTEKEGYSTEEWDPGDIIPTHIHFITEAVPEVDGTTSVCSVMEDLCIDPEVLVTLTADCIQPMRDSGKYESFMYITNALTKRAREITERIIPFDNEVLDFWEVMEAEEDAFLREELGTSPERKK